MVKLGRKSPQGDGQLSASQHSIFRKWSLNRLDIGDAILPLEAFPQFEALLTSIRRQLQRFKLWSIDFFHSEGNRCVNEISLSVIRDQRYQSYIVCAGPS
ncbi:hypothetical protein YC2023_037747 [Brassica napus]